MIGTSVWTHAEVGGGDCSEVDGFGCGPEGFRGYEMTRKDLGMVRW